MNTIADATGALHDTTNGRFAGHTYNEADPNQILYADSSDPLTTALLDLDDDWHDQVPAFDQDPNLAASILNVSQAMPGNGFRVYVVEEYAGGDQSTGIDVMVPVMSGLHTFYLTKTLPLEEFEAPTDEPGIPTARHYLQVLTDAREQLDAAAADLQRPKLSKDDFGVLAEMFTDAQSGWDSFDETDEDFGDYSDEDKADQMASRARQQALMDKLTNLLSS